MQTLPAPVDSVSSKLNLVGLDICEIDAVPGSLPGRIHTLYLSNNLLSSLDGVEQFTSVRHVSFANNMVKYLSDVRALALLPHLEKVTLEGNAVTGMPFYRQYLIGMCAALTSVDGVAVSAEERRHAKTYSRQLSAFYDQLRLNELQNIILRHLRLQLAMHVEFQRVVIGRFRSLRREYMPSTQEMQLSAQAGRGHGVSFLLAQCLAGGVYRWLMLACGMEIDKAVQMMAHRAHLTVLSRLSPKDRAQVVKVPQTGAQHWEAIVAESLKHQQQARLQLLADCEKLHTVSANGASSSSSSSSSSSPMSSAAVVDREVMAVLQRLEFEAAALHTAAVAQERMDAGRRSAAYCGIGVSTHSHGRPGSDRKSSTSPQRARAKHQRAHVSFADTSTDLQALQDEVQSRYLDLLRQVEAGAAGVGAAPSAVPTDAPSDDAGGGGGGTVSDDALAAFLQAAREELADLEVVLAQEDQFWGIQEAEETWTALETMTDAEREAALGPAPTPVDPTLLAFGEAGEAAAASMKVLKGRVDAALLDLAVRRRSEVLAWEANDTLRIAARSKRKAAIDCAEKAVKRLEDLHDRIRRARTDIQQATRWTTSLQSTIEVVREEKSKVATMHELLDKALAAKKTNEDELGGRAARAAARRQAIADAHAALKRAEQETALELAAADAESDGGTSVSGSGARFNVLDAVAHRAAALLRAVVRAWRLHTRAENRLAALAKAHRQRAGVPRGAHTAFATWKRLAAVARRGKAVERWHQLHVTTSRCFQCWVAKAGRERTARDAEQRILRHRGRGYLRFWHTAAREGRKATLKSRRQRGAALCFLVKRIFRAWRAYVATFHTEEPTAVAAAIVRATAFWKGRLFRAWASSHRDRLARVHSCADALTTHRAREAAVAAFAEWRAVAQTARFLDRSQKVRTFRALATRAARQRCARADMRVARQRERSARLRRALRHLRSSAALTAALRRVRHEAGQRAAEALLHRCWQRWRRQSIHVAPTPLASSVSFSRDFTLPADTDRQEPVSASRRPRVHVPEVVPTTPAARPQWPAPMSAVQLRWSAMQEQLQRSTDLTDPGDDNDDDDVFDDVVDDPRWRRRRLAVAVGQWTAYKAVRRHLRARHCRVVEQRHRRTARTAFAGIVVAWARATRAKAAAAKADADNATPSSDAADVRDQLRGEIQAVSEQAAGVAASIDESSALLLDAVDTCDTLRLQIEDATLSAATMKREQEHAQEAASLLREESRAVRMLSDAYMSSLPVLPEAVATAPPTAAIGEPLSPLHAAADAMREEGASLARDREGTADRARGAKALAQRQQQQLEARVTAVAAEAARLDARTGALDEELAGLRERCAAGAVELLRVEQAVAAVRERDAATVRFHEDLVARMEKELAATAADAAEAKAEEKALQDEVRELRTQIAAQYRVQVRFFWNVCVCV